LENGTTFFYQEKSKENNTLPDRSVYSTFGPSGWLRRPPGKKSVAKAALQVTSASSWQRPPPGKHPAATAALQVASASGWLRPPPGKQPAASAELQITCPYRLTLCVISIMTIRRITIND